jgi:hypothetical protein
MTSPTMTGLLGPLIETLVEETDPLMRDRILFEAVKSSGVARDLALWREADPDGSGHEQQWIALYASCSPSELPAQSHVSAAADGKLDWALPHGQRVLVAGAAGRRVALALTGEIEDEGAGDRLDALFQAYALIGAADPRTALPSLQEWLPGLGPSTTASRSVAPGQRREFVHDLRNLLACIRTTQDLLDEFGDGLDADERATYGETLERELRRAGDLVATCMAPADFAGREPGPAPTVSQVAREVAAAEQAAWTALGLRLSVTIDPEVADQRSPLDELDLARVLLNLLWNARQALSSAASPARPGAGARLRVRAGPDAASPLLVEVEDDGPGLPPMSSERLFERGVSLSAESGRGLGLAVVRELVEAAGGRAQALERPEGGALFRLAFPKV